MVYIKINPSPTLTSEQRADEINRELQKISRPNPVKNEITEFRFRKLLHPTTGDACLSFEATDSIPVNSQVDVTKLKNLMLQEASAQELAQLEMYLKTLIGKRVVFNQIVPQSVTRYTQQELELEGWFTYPDINFL